MNLLSPQLQAKIEARPTNTQVRSENDKLDSHFVKMPKQSKIMLLKDMIPNQFDGRDVWQGALTPVANQGTCGSCWAFASSDVLANRFNIQSMGLMHVHLSAAKMILCDISDYSLMTLNPWEQGEQLAQIQESNIKTSACFGNTLYNAWAYLYINGTNTNKCIPYKDKYGQFDEISALGTFTTPEHMPVCTQVTGILRDMCADFTYNRLVAEEEGTPARFYRALHFYAVAGVKKDGGSELNIRSDIYHWGPVSTGMKVYADFYMFDPKTEIYEWNGSGPQVGGHAIEIVGWGEDNSVPYWIVKNSWGSDWGLGGYFRMVRGKNNCEIEENVIAGVPDYFYPETYKSPVTYLWGEDEQIKYLHPNLINSIKSVSGGIDPETGYTRRILATMPWVDFSRPVNLDDLPDYRKWIAGIDGSVKKRVLYQNIVEYRKKDIDYGNQALYTAIIVILLLVVILTTVIILFFRK